MARILYMDGDRMQHQVNFIARGPEMHHCSSIARDDSGYFICYYHGSECTDGQRVAVSFFEEVGKEVCHIDLDYKTGNPIVWTFKDQVYLMYSLFTDATIDGVAIGYGRSPVDRWKNCDNYLAKISYQNGKIEYEELGKINGAYGLLGRCQPLIEEDRVLLPLYREEDPACQIWEFVLKDGQPSLSMLSEFGTISEEMKESCARIGLGMSKLGNGVAIQPTLTFSNGRYIAICRNVCRPSSREVDHNCKAWVTSSEDCKSWDKLAMAGIPNHNNSVAAVSRGNQDDLVVFNSNRSRSDMILYGVKSRNKINLDYMLNKMRVSFSYPNIVLDEGDLHVVHTNCGMIAWHYFNKEFVQEAF